MANAMGRSCPHHQMFGPLERTVETRHARDGRILEVAEIGWRGGGAFPPHKPHRMGLSADIMTPMRRGRPHPGDRVGP